MSIRLWFFHFSYLLTTSERTSISLWPKLNMQNIIDFYAADCGETLYQSVYKRDLIIHSASLGIHPDCIWCIPFIVFLFTWRPKAFQFTDTCIIWKLAWCIRKFIHYFNVKGITLTKMVKTYKPLNAAHKMVQFLISHNDIFWYY